MPSLKDIRTRIDATKNTQQITKAMKLVAAAKLRKAQQQIVSMRPYAQGLMYVIQNLVKADSVKHPLIKGSLGEQVELNSSEAKNLLLVILTSDRGLCGGFNGQVIKFSEAFIEENKTQYDKIDVFIVGKKGAEYFARRGAEAVEVIYRLDKDISYNLATQLGSKLTEYFTSGNYQEIKFVFNEFKSAISQKVNCEQLLPITHKAHVQEGISKELNLVTPEARQFIFEPASELILNELIEKHIVVQIFRYLAESVAAEHGARMTAMENATNNARDVISKLTLTYNKIRQEKITTELTEIVSGAEAL